MDEFDAAEILKRYWLDQCDRVLAQQIVLTTCPYCGKADRIHLLNHKDNSAFDSDEEYSAAWKRLGSSEKLPAICRFCLNVVVVTKGKAQMPGDY